MQDIGYSSLYFTVDPVHQLCVRVCVFMYWCVSVSPVLLIFICPTPFPLGNHQFIFSVCESPSVFVNKFISVIF